MLTSRDTIFIINLHPLKLIVYYFGWPYIYIWGAQWSINTLVAQLSICTINHDKTWFIKWQKKSNHTLRRILNSSIGEKQKVKDRKERVHRAEGRLRLYLPLLIKRDETLLQSWFPSTCSVTDTLIFLLRMHMSKHGYCFFFVLQITSLVKILRQLPYVRLG